MAARTHQRRWWCDPESRALADALAARFCALHYSPVLRLAILRLAESTPTPEQLAWARRDPVEREPTTPLPAPLLTTWSADVPSAQAFLAAAAQYGLTHQQVQRLALRVLADAEGLALPVTVPA